MSEQLRKTLKEERKRLKDEGERELTSFKRKRKGAVKGYCFRRCP
jgi:hypothetical protein